MYPLRMGSSVALLCFIRNWMALQTYSEYPDICTGRYLYIQQVFRQISRQTDGYLLMTSNRYSDANPNICQMFET